MIFMMSKLKISMLESVELNIQTDFWAIAGHCQTWRQATARLLGWLHHAGDGLDISWVNPMV